MKTVINNAAAESLEFAKRILYSFEVLVIGALIPVLFIIGINTNYGNTLGNETNISKYHQVNATKVTADNLVFLSGKHS